MRITSKVLFIIGCFLIAFFMWLPRDKKWSKEELLVTPKKEDIVQVSRSDGRVQKLEMSTYLEGVLPAEMPVSFEKEALKAQCVAARTFVYARNNVVDDTTSSQVYQDDEMLRAKWGDSYNKNIAYIRQVIKETGNEVCLYNNALISATFYSSSCGKSAKASQYWQNDVPYLQSVDSPWDRNAYKYQDQKIYSTTELATLLGFTNAIHGISDVSYYDSGYVNTINIDGIVFSGREVREKLNLRSSAFKASIKDDQVVFDTFGFGHGVGMSQYGAHGMAIEGKDYKEILKHYYQGIEIMNKDV